MEKGLLKMKIASLQAKLNTLAAQQGAINRAELLLMSNEINDLITDWTKKCIHEINNKNK